MEVAAMIGAKETYKGFLLTVTEQPTGGFRAEIDTSPAGRWVWTMTFTTALEAMFAAARTCPQLVQ
jgi:hypothetical protein